VLRYVTGVFSLEQDLLLARAAQMQPLAVVVLLMAAGQQCYVTVRQAAMWA